MPTKAMIAVNVQEKSVNRGMRIVCAALCPGIFPRATDEVDRIEVEVIVMPEASVIISVSAVGEAVIVGRALALTVAPSRRGLYVLVPRSEETMSPTDAGTEVLKTYAGVVGVTVERRELGKVVATVVDAEAKNDEIAVTFSAISLTLALRGYSPIIGGSLSSIP